MPERKETAVWLTEQAPGSVEVESPNTGTFDLLDDAWVTSRYDATVDYNNACVEVHTTGDAWTCDLAEEVTVR